MARKKAAKSERAGWTIVAQRSDPEYLLVRTRIDDDKVAWARMWDRRLNRFSREGIEQGFLKFGYFEPYDGPNVLDTVEAEQAQVEV